MNYITTEARRHGAEATTPEDTEDTEEEDRRDQDFSPDSSDSSSKRRSEAGVSGSEDASCSGEK